MSKIRRNRKRKKKKNYYFSKEVENAIILYNDPKTAYLQKCRIYKKHIFPAFDKLVENIIHTNKYYNFEDCYEDTKHEVVAELTKKLGKYSPDRGKAFSFFDRSCRNYLISYNKRVYKKKIIGEDLDCVDEERDLEVEMNEESAESILKDFMTLWVDDLSNRIFKMFYDTESLSVADSILILFKNRETLDFYNKKALYILIKERSRVSDTNTITNIVRILKKDFYNKYEDFLNNNYYG